MDKDYEKLFSFLKPHHQGSRESLLQFCQSWQIVELPSQTVMTHQGDIEKYSYFVLEGWQKSFSIRDDGKQFVQAFTYPPSLSGVPDSFLNQTPARVQLETVTRSRFLAIHYQRFNELLEADRQIECMLRLLLQNMLAELLARQIEFQSHSARERFENFMKRSGQLLNLIPHKDIASYLRIDATNFSKLLSEFRK